jgi:hypothetical protein
MSQQCCIVHGCKMQPQQNVHPLQNHAYGPSYYCPQCRTERQTAESEEIAEAKKMLGL